METDDNGVNMTSSSRKPPFAVPSKKLDPLNLIGNIVEKGFSSSKSQQEQKLTLSSLPKPTVFPFPVARHRSHGPHWAPVGIELQDVDDEEDRDDTSFDPIAASAHPIQRKQKKGLDFSKWRELGPPDISATLQEKKENVLALVNQREENREKDPATSVENRNLSEVGVSCKNSNTESHMASNMDLVRNGQTDQRGSGSLTLDPVTEYKSLPVPDMAKYQDTRSDVFENREQGSFSVIDVYDESHIPLENSQKDDGNKYQAAGHVKLKGNEKGSLPFMSEIDAENNARLQKMTPEEIAEAQAEIMEKLRPEVLEMLKRRGRDRTGKQKKATENLVSGDDHSTVDNGNHLNQDSKSTPILDGEPSNVAERMHTAPAFTKGDSDGQPSTDVPSTSAWNAWTDRVEKVRALRFSLDGSVLENDSVQIPRGANHVENVTERDFLRTEGDPGGAGYTIKEAVALIRSMVPGQRTLALHLLASLLDKTLGNLQADITRNVGNASHVDKFIDWPAIWAFALGPEPELVLSLRMSLDDNHISVVLACLKVIQCILSCDLNENFFNFSERLTTYVKSIYTAPIFRSKPEIGTGFFHGGFWKYSAKPSNLFPFREVNANEENEEDEGKHTIQDDIVVAGQDVAAGLVRMGILPRIRYLLEMDPVAALEESLVSVLIGLARHSPASVNAIIMCPRLVQIVVDRLIKKATMQICPSTIKAVAFLRVLAESDKKICEDFITHGIFQDAIWHLYKCTFSLDNWVKSGREYCKLTSGLMVEQLHFWKVCIQYGYCTSYFSDFFPSMCFWLSLPTFDQLIESNVLGEYASVTREAYLTLEALATRLPYLHSEKQLKDKVVGADNSMEAWSWNHVVPMIELAIKWISLKSSPYLSLMFSCLKETASFAVKDSSMSCLLWVISAVMHMLSTILERITPSLHETCNTLPWLPEFVPRIGLVIVKNGIFNLSGTDNEEFGRFPSAGRSFVEDLCHLRNQNDYETSLSSLCCLHDLIRLIISIDKSIQMVKSPSRPEYIFSQDDKIVGDGILKWCGEELRNVLIMFMKLISKEWQELQSVEIFGRGGPAPGVGFGWGGSGGGFWSRCVLLAEMHAQLMVDLLDIFPVILDKDPSTVQDTNVTSQMINSVFGVCLVAGPRNTVIIEKALGILLQIPVMKYLDFCIHHFLRVKGIKSFRWEYKEEDYLSFGKILNSHFRNRWLRVKRKKKSTESSSQATNDKSNSQRKKFKKGGGLDAIHEDLDESVMTDDLNCTSLMVEWAHQRLPLPVHWFLSPLSTIGDVEAACMLPAASKVEGLMCSAKDVLDAAKSGLFLLLGVEAMAALLCSDISYSPILNIPLVWKLHALSMLLLVKMDVLEDDNSRDTYETLQEVYGHILDQSRYGSNNFVLKFKTDIHESYTTFVETLVEQFSSTSYGDMIYGRQVALYLHCSVEAPVRLAVWNAICNAHVLELLPSIEGCFAKTDGYLEPIEDNEEILEAYMKSWISGSLERAAARGSVSFTLVLHHLSSFIFHKDDDVKLSLRKKLARSILRDYSSKQHHEDMILNLIQYKLVTLQELEWKDGTSLQTDKIRRRLEFISEACEGNSSLLAVVQKLKSKLAGKFSI